MQVLSNWLKMTLTSHEYIKHQNMWLSSHLYSGYISYFFVYALHIFKMLIGLDILGERNT